MTFNGNASLKTDKKEISYKINPSHRRSGNPNKSIWTITQDEEITCFQLALSKGWLEEKTGWGIKQNQIGKLEQIGLSPLQEPLKIAKFRDDSQTKEWHGHPADYQNNQQDRPSTKILQIWRNDGIIAKHHITKIRSGKQCNL
ncbi:MAG: hypothetical protein V7L14_23970 [Nostoc sp.]|uniref:hypothetical protein n=1 Tax=unclassified Nostoc TaxID=2593658 RepID=UPI0025DBB787|nr:hypothetical protein [Nostoc sp. NOS(2021)]MBN3897636.1 hypothetical protein [Nostoc sp. NOS(2021)]